MARYIEAYTLDIYLTIKGNPHKIKVYIGTEYVEGRVQNSEHEATHS